ncbi:hypothetical protein SASPL_150972 [Salvia splendens]|uniref:Uncharacterized protein n=1 Tax=Salvia splendens TaxID=180675 RepID=A0A8X8Z284_SALSN|nr:hypothetical protein SASPL_150972 [Salvia splendens]
MKLGQNAYSSSSSDHKCLMLWRKLKRGKKKSSEFPFAKQKTYDPQSYMQNFDEGSASATFEPDIDNLYQSFSARYANPSRFDPDEFRRSTLIDV